MYKRYVMKKRILLCSFLVCIILPMVCAGAESVQTEPIQWKSFFSGAWEHSMRAKEKQIELQSYKLEADTVKNNLYPQITFDIPEIIGWKRINAAPFWARIPALAGTRYLNALQGNYGISLTQKLPSGGSLTATGSLQSEYLLQAALFRHTPQFSLLYRQPLTRGIAAFSAEVRAVQTRFEIFQTMHRQAYKQFMKTLLESIAELDTMRTHTEYYRLNAVYHTAKYDEIEKKQHTGNATAPELLDAKRNMLKAQQEYELNRTAFTLKEKAFTVRYGDSALVLHETDKDTLADFLHCTDTRDNYEAQLLTGKKQLLDAELLSVKKDEAPQLLVKFSAVPDELVFRFSSDYGTSWELLSHNVPWIFHASIGIVWSPDYFSRAAAKSELLKNRSSLIDLQLHELHEQRQHETLLLREKIASVEQAYGLMQQYTAEQASLLKEYCRLYEEHRITESAYEQINAEYALQVYLQAQAFWQLIAAKAEYLFL